MGGVGGSGVGCQLKWFCLLFFWLPGQTQGWWACWLPISLLPQALKDAPWCPPSILWRRCTTHCLWNRLASSSPACARTRGIHTLGPPEVRHTNRHTPVCIYRHRSHTWLRSAWPAIPPSLCSFVSHVWCTQPAVSRLVHPSKGPLFLHLAQISFWQASLVWVSQHILHLSGSDISRFLCCVTSRRLGIIYGSQVVPYSLF